MLAELVFLATATGTNTSMEVSLSSLEKRCTLEQRGTGFVVGLSTAIWLRCGDHEVLVVHPLNLVGHVRIATPEQALEFVRFFSRVETYGSARFGGMVEVRPAPGGGSPGFNEVPPTVFEERFTPASAIMFQGAKGEQIGKRFWIKRPVFMRDGSVREVVETVFEDGYYSCDSSLVIMADGKRVGLVYPPVE